MSGKDDILAEMKARMLEHGMNKCGVEIANIVREHMHPDALLVIPMYRSCLVLERDTTDEGNPDVVHAYTYGDPHWRGGEITQDALKEEYEYLGAFVGQRTGAQWV